MKFKAGDVVSGIYERGVILGASTYYVHVRWDDYEYDPFDSGPYEQMYHSELPDRLVLISSEQDEIATYHQPYAEKIVNDCMDILKDAIQIHSLAVKKDMS